MSELRASQPEVPMVSTLDLLSVEYPLTEEDVVPVFEEDEEDKDCGNPSCNRRVEMMRAQISDLNQQIDTLSGALKSVTRRYRVLKRRTSAKGSARVQQVTKKLLSSLGPDEESGNTPPSTHEEPSDTQRRMIDSSFCQKCSCEGGTHRGRSGHLCTFLFLQL